jgi:hypothetical protein
MTSCNVQNPVENTPSWKEEEIMTNYIDMNIGVSKSDLDKIGADSIAVPGTDMFVGGLSVYHELHCLVRSPTRLA